MNTRARLTILVGLTVVWVCQILVQLTAEDEEIQGKQAATLSDQMRVYELHQLVQYQTQATFVPPSKAMKTFCVPWSINTDEWWSQNVDWDVAEENDEFTCFRKQNEVDASSKASLWKRLHANQFVSSEQQCDKTLTRHMWSSGFGTDLENVVLGLQRALELNVPLTVVPIGPRPWWHYSANKQDGSNATCPARDLSCYFLPLTNCQPQIDKLDKSAVTMVRKYAKDFGHAYNYVTRPQQWLRKAIHDFIHHESPIMNTLTAPCTVMHVRRADIVLHAAQSRKYYALEDYINLMPRKDDTVLLLTDDANAIDEAREFHKNTVRWVYFNRTRHRGTSGGWEEQIPSKSPKQEVVTILATLRLVERCNVLIHSRSKFADALSRVMGPEAQRFQVDKGVDLAEENSKSVEELHAKLEEKRKSLESTSSEKES